MEHDELAWLAIQASKARYILEIGSHRGRSTRAMADNTKGFIHAVDPWEPTYFKDDGTPLGNSFDVYPQFEQNLKEHITSGRVAPFKMHSIDFFAPISYDLIFIDGDHRYSAVKNDIKLGLDCINPKGIIAGHDYTHNDWPGVKKAVDEFFGTRVKRAADSIWFVEA